MLKIDYIIYNEMTLWYNSRIIPTANQWHLNNKTNRCRHENKDIIDITVFK